MMDRLAPACEAIAGTTKKNEKVRIVAGYLRSRTVDEAAVSAVFLSGRVFPAYKETTLQVGGTMLWRALLEVSGTTETVLVATYRRYGDLGSAAFDVLSSHSAGSKAASLNVLDIARVFSTVAGTRGPAAKQAMIEELLLHATPLEAKYLVKIMTGELRIGLKESLVEEGIAAAYGATLTDVQRANMLLGDIGETLRYACEERLQDAAMRLLHPIGFMLASPVESTQEAFEYFSHVQVEDKYDGIRAQAHCSGDRVRIFSRTLDDVTDSFPELVEPLAALPGELVLDGEVVAWRFADAGGQALPFSELQKRLGRKTVSTAMLRDIPVAYVVFDVLYAQGELVIDKPLRERAVILDKLFAGAESIRSIGAKTTRAKKMLLRTPDPQGRLEFEPAILEENTVCAPNAMAAVIRAPVLSAESPDALEKLFRMALERGNEGLMIKDLNSIYTPGRRGKSWLKLKRELATLDVVVTAAEFGHGKRSGVLSDYTFAVRSGDRLLNIGKAYSGLTDAEIAELTQWFLTHTVTDYGFMREVEPRIVLEVAFNAIMQSDRHNSGYSLRFPRILRIRWDKLPGEIDSLQSVREIFDWQHRLNKSA